MEPNYGSLNETHLCELIRWNRLCISGLSAWKLVSAVVQTKVSGYMMSDKIKSAFTVFTCSSWEVREIYYSLELVIHKNCKHTSLAHNDATRVFIRIGWLYHSSAADLRKTIKKSENVGTRRYRAKLKPTNVSKHIPTNHARSQVAMRPVKPSFNKESHREKSTMTIGAEQSSEAE